MNTPLKQIGSRCREQRKAKGWTQQEVTNKTKIHRSVISAIENGSYTGSLKALVAYTSLLGLELTVKAASVPQFNELRELFGDD